MMCALKYASHLAYFSFLTLKAPLTTIQTSSFFCCLYITSVKCIHFHPVDLLRQKKQTKKKMKKKSHYKKANYYIYSYFMVNIPLYLLTATYLTPMSHMSRSVGATRDACSCVHSQNVYKHGRNEKKN